MKSQQAAFINSIVLIVVGFWGYVANHFLMHTLIVPLGAGILFMILSKFLKNENKGLIQFMMIITLALFFAFIVPFQRNMEQADLMGMLRLAIEMAACAFAFIVYLRHLIQLNKAQAV
jgi:uncharacterized membrane protein (UPF0136 family)